jgi:hypothetical protein
MSLAPQAGRSKELLVKSMEHLKKAENKIITALIPHIQLFRKIPQERKNTMRLLVDAS